MTYTAQGASDFRQKGGTLAEKITSEFALIDTELDAHATLLAAVTESMLAPASTEGLHAARIARTVYDFSVDGGAIGSIALGATLPIKSRVVKFWYDVVTTLKSATDAATVAISIPTDDVAGLVAATAISAEGNVWDAGLHAGIQDGAVANISEKCTAARALTMTIAQEALTAGKIVFFAEYVVSA